MKAVVKSQSIGQTPNYESIAHQVAWLKGSSGFIEIAAKTGSATAILGAGIGEKILMG